MEATAREYVYCIYAPPASPHSGPRWQARRRKRGRSTIYYHCMLKFQAITSRTLAVVDGEDVSGLAPRRIPRKPQLRFTRTVHTLHPRCLPHARSQAHHGHAPPLRSHHTLLRLIILASNRILKHPGNPNYTIIPLPQGRARGLFGEGCGGGGRLRLQLLLDCRARRAPV